MKLFYISQGNIPSKWAHTFQAMKMAEAFASRVDDVRMLTRGHWLAPLFPRFDFKGWYGLRKPFRVVRLPSRGTPLRGIIQGVRYPRFDEAAVRHAKRKHADLVYTRSAYAGLLAARAGLSTILETHMEFNHPEFAKVLEAAGHPSLRGVVTISPELRDLYRDAGLEADILVWPDAMDPEKFTGLPAKSELRARHAIPKNAFTAVYCGNLYPDRGVEEILAAAKLLPHIHFVLAGGWDKDVAERRAQAKHMPNAAFPGFVPNGQLPGLLAAADCLLMPYSAKCNTAGWMSPLKMFEYMASGRPVIATDLPALRKHIEDGRNGLLVPSGDGAALAEAVKRLAGDPALAHRLGDQGREDVAPYSWDNRARDILEWAGR